MQEPLFKRFIADKNRLLSIVLTWAVLLVLPLNSWALELFIWKPTNQAPRMVLPIRDGESQVQAIKRYLGAIGRNPDTLRLKNSKPFRSAKSKFSGEPLI